MSTPPELPAILAEKRPRKGLVIGLVTGGIVLLLLGVDLISHIVVASGITKGPDNMFGDQNLKTAVALIELYKVRYGKYPGSMHEIKFTGQWDQLAVTSVAYYPNASRTRYYVEVQRGWIGKPTLTMPEEFWQGTGYSAELKPRTE